LAEDAAQVNFQAGDEQEEYDAQGGNGFQRDGKVAGGWKNKCVQFGFEMAQESGTEQNSGENFAEHRGLIELLHDLAGELGGAEQHRQSDEQMHYVVWSEMRHSLGPLACRESRSSSCLTRAGGYRNRMRQPIRKLLRRAATHYGTSICGLMDSGFASCIMVIGAQAPAI
jgi:hypothetical protein